jgi:hypothetical protein
MKPKVKSNTEIIYNFPYSSFKISWKIFKMYTNWLYSTQRFHLPCLQYPIVAEHVQIKIYLVTFKSKYNYYVIKLLMSLTETRTKLLSGSEVCPPGPLPSSHCIITSNIVVLNNIYYAYTYKYLPIKLYA